MAKKNNRKPADNRTTKQVVVIGTSAGGNKALIKLVSQLNPSISAAFFIVIHMTNVEANKLFAKRLQQATPLPCHIADTDMPIEMGHIYLAPANSHLMIKKNKILLGHGPPENRYRPSIDILFRSAAASWDSHVTGIILTGLLNDGVAGMIAIHRSGGVCIVQDPEEAEYADMPRAVLKIIQPDYCIPINNMGDTLEAIMKKPKLLTAKEIPADIIAEANLAERSVTRINDLDEVGNQSIFTCPDCGGSLWNITTDGINRYRCYTGHTFTENDLLQKQTEAIEDTLWTALRIMEEKKNLALKMEADFRKKGFTTMATHNREQAKKIDVHINRLRSILFNNKSSL